MDDGDVNDKYKPKPVRRAAIKPHAKTMHDQVEEVLLHEDLEYNAVGKGIEEDNNRH